MSGKLEEIKLSVKIFPFYFKKWLVYLDVFFYGIQMWYMLLFNGIIV